MTRASAVLMKWTVKMGMKTGVKMMRWQERITGPTAVSMQEPWRCAAANMSVTVCCYVN
jgi:hypothetical protein